MLFCGIYIQHNVDHSVPLVVVCITLFQFAYKQLRRSDLREQRADMVYNATDILDIITIAGGTKENGNSILVCISVILDAIQISPPEYSP